MSTDLIFFIIFIIILVIFYLIKKDKFEIQGKVIALYRTKLGLNLMEKFSKHKFLKFIGITGVIIGFIGMIFIFYILIDGTIRLMFVEGAQPTLAPVLPGIQIPGLPRLSFFHWILSIFIVATIHEFSHGVLARFHNVRIKSSGFAFFGPILAAFVEPDENQLKNKSKLAQLSVFAAGPFSNIILGLLVFLVLTFFLAPFSNSLLQYEGIQIASLEEDLPAANAGLKQGDLILEINGIELGNIEDFTDVMKKIKPNQEITITTNETEFTFITTENPNNKSRGYLGVMVSSHKADLKESVKSKYGDKLPWSIFWIVTLFFWLYVINLGIGLFNLLPLGPIDGGRMFNVALSHFIKDQEKIKKIFIAMSFFILLLIFINLLPYLIRLLSFIFTPLLTLII